MCLLSSRRSGDETSRPIKVEIVDVEKVKGLSKYYVSKGGLIYSHNHRSVARLRFLLVLLCVSVQ